MKHLKSYNESKLKIFQKNKEEGMVELNDILVDLVDTGIEDLDIYHLEGYNFGEGYKIEYNIPCGINFSHDTKYSFDVDKVSISKEIYNKFNDSMKETYSLLERVESMGYKVVKFNTLLVEVSSDRKLQHIEIRISK